MDKTDKTIREGILTLLTALQDKGELFNKMGGSLYSALIADEMSAIHNELKDAFGVEVKYTQPCPGRVLWLNLDELIEEYSS